MRDRFPVSEFSVRGLKDLSGFGGLGFGVFGYAPFELFVS